MDIKHGLLLHWYPFRPIGDVLKHPHGNCSLDRTGHLANRTVGIRVYWVTLNPPVYIIITNIICGSAINSGWDYCSLAKFYYTEELICHGERFCESASHQNSRIFAADDNLDIFLKADFLVFPQQNHCVLCSFNLRSKGNFENAGE